MKKSKLVVKDPRPGRHIMSILSKEYFDHYFHEKGYRVTQFKKKLGIPSSLYYKTYHYYYDKEQRSDFFKKRISEVQRKSNSNRKNWGKPRILLDKSELENYLLDGRSMEWIAHLLGIAPQTVKKNINYYEISLDDIGYCKFLSYDKQVELKQLDSFFGTELLDMHKGERRDIQSIIDQSIVISMQLKEYGQTIRKVIRSAKSYAKANGIKFEDRKLPSSTVNYNFFKAFQECGYDCENEFKLGDKYYDLKIKGTNIIVEVDSKHYHDDKKYVLNDIEKTKLAEEKGFFLVRISTDRDKYPTIRLKVEKCLKNLKSNGLFQ
jgi:very-short-patch-repair endonuclease